MSRFITVAAPEQMFFVNVEDISRVSLAGDIAEVFLRSGGNIRLTSPNAIAALIKRMNSLLIPVEEAGDEVKGGKR
ncbi:MAG: hypothetical protein M3348_04915 [Acidobacteriota bacterium]|nr:hypothetical protein [Acidobacteriota bacterium]